MKGWNRRIRWCVALIGCALLLDAVVGACTSRFTPLPNSPLSVVVGDFNGDGKLDIAVSQAGGLTGVRCNTFPPDPACVGTEILLGNGDGTYQDFRDPSGTPVRVANILAQLAVTPFNGNAHFD